MKIDGAILTPRGFVFGALQVSSDGRIQVISGDEVDEKRARDSGRPIVMPGFIDLHVHGGEGRDIMEGGDAALAVARCHASHGTTSLLATTMTAPANDLKDALEGLRALCHGRAPRAARILGVHLEGPYISPNKLGAQPAYARPLSLDEVDELNAIAPVRLLTIAPEVPGNMAALQALAQAGYRVQIGHTLGSYEQGREALTKGASGFAHLFNAMSGLHHREPGMVGAALAHSEYAEIIPDLLHVHPGAIRAAMRAIPHLYCVTDSTAASGMPDGDYQLGRQTVTKCLGGVRLPNGTLAGSALTMDQALRNLVNRIGLTLIDASNRVSAFPARYLGIGDRGRLEAGAWADIAVLDSDLKLTAVYLEGERLEHADAAGSA